MYVHNLSAMCVRIDGLRTCDKGCSGISHSDLQHPLKEKLSDEVCLQVCPLNVKLSIFTCCK